MKIELLLNDDEELRAYIKELIKNEVINISREEIKQVATNALNKKINNTYNTTNLQKLLEDELAKQISSKLRTSYYDRTSLEEYILKTITNLVNKELSELSVKITANIIRELNR